jgi:hypothetical protein
VFKDNGDFQGVTNKEQECEDGMVLEPKDARASPELCLRCGTNKRNCFLLECGHMAYCEACGQAAKLAKEECPLCRWPIANATAGFVVRDDGLCLICCQNKTDSIVTPCGHTGCCKDCLQQWFQSSSLCPYCGTDRSSYRVIMDWL